MGCYIWYIEEGTGRGRSLPRPLLAVPNVSPPTNGQCILISVLLYNGPLLCGFSVLIKGLITMEMLHVTEKTYSKISKDGL